MCRLQADCRPSGGRGDVMCIATAPHAIPAAQAVHDMLRDGMLSPKNAAEKIRRGMLRAVRHRRCARQQWALQGLARKCTTAQQTETEDRTRGFEMQCRR